MVRATPRGTIDVLLCIADHFEPAFGAPGERVERERVRRWVSEYPARFERFRDCSGRPPQHTFFYPADQYRPRHLDELRTLCARGFGEVEVHLHHGHDTSAALAETLCGFRDTLASEHGLLSRDERGAIRYGFIHGNWALDNSGPDDSTCGVNDEIDVLIRSGCYADFTMPSAPHSSQTGTVNSIYHAVDDPLKPKSHDRGQRARAGMSAPPGLLMIQGPLGISWRWRERLRPRLENGEIHGSHPPTARRMRDWIASGVSVEGRPNWVFVKLHTHGAVERNAAVLLGDAMTEFHRSLAAGFNDGTRFRLHYVTAREMANVVAAAEDGQQGDPRAFRDYRFRSNVRCAD